MIASLLVKKCSKFLFLVAIIVHVIAICHDKMKFFHPSPMWEKNEKPLSTQSTWTALLPLDTVSKFLVDVLATNVIGKRVLILCLLCHLQYCKHHVQYWSSWSFCRRKSSTCSGASSSSSSMSYCWWEKGPGSLPQMNQSTMTQSKKSTLCCGNLDMLDTSDLWEAGLKDDKEDPSQKNLTNVRKWIVLLMHWKSDQSHCLPVQENCRNLNGWFATKSWETIAEVDEL